MIHASRETAELTRADGDTFAFHANDQSALKHDEAFIALQVRVWHWIAKWLNGVIVPDLKPLRSKTNLVRGRVP
jgi:hypothetical protein